MNQQGKQQNNDPPLKIVCVTGQESQEGCEHFSVTTSAAPEDLSKLRIAVISPQQADSLTEIHAYPAIMFAELRELLHVNVGAKRMPSSEDILRERKAIRRLLDALPPYGRDEIAAGEAEFGRKVVNELGSDGDAIKRWIDEVVNAAKDEGFMTGCTIQDPHEAARVVDSFMQEACMTFPSTDVPATLSEIAHRKGNPEIIVFYGHGGPDALKAPMGGYDHLSGEDIARAIPEDLSPSMVVFVSCLGHGVALSAQKWWSSARPDAFCTFLGPATERPFYEIRDGSLIVVRLLSRVLAHLVRLALGCARSIQQFSLPNQTSVGAAIIFTGERVSKKKLVDLYWVTLRNAPSKIAQNDLYYSGEYQKNEASVLIDRALNNAHHDVWCGMIEVYTQTFQ